MHARHAAELLHLLQLLGEIIEIEGALLHAGGDLLRLLVIDRLRRASRRGSRRRPCRGCGRRSAGVEVLEPVEFFARAHELDRLAGHRPHRQGRSAAAIAVDPGQHDAADADLLIEALREIDRVLSGERIGDEQRLMRLRDVAYGLPPRPSASRRYAAGRRCRASRRHSRRASLRSAPAG